MKKIMVIFLLVLYTNIFAFNEIDTCFTEKEIINISNHISDLEQKDSLKDKLILELKYQIINFNNINKQDSLYIEIQNREIELREFEILTYKELYINSKPKFYENKIIWFLLGATTIITSSWVIFNIK